MSPFQYSNEFFEFHEDRSRQSAHEVLPLVRDWVDPKSVIDVGCGTGAWLAEWKALGVGDYLGIDGAYVTREKLLIEPARFLARDLTRPLAIDRQFDLAMCLEVVEHLPAQHARSFIESLTRLAGVILFSAAIPFQGGTDHVNEQWPDYWHALFRDRDYVPIDCLRGTLWNNQNVEPWYRQNLLFYVYRKRLVDFPKLAQSLTSEGGPPLSLVHPDHYLRMRKEALDKIRASQRWAMHHALRLREINLAVFPDWRQPLALLRQQIVALLDAAWAHPDGRRIALVFNVGKEFHQPATKLLQQLAQEKQVASGVPGPEVTAVGDAFGVEAWETLVDCLHGRVSMSADDQQAISEVGAARLATIALSTIQARKPLIVK